MEQIGIIIQVYTRSGVNKNLRTCSSIDDGKKIIIETIGNILNKENFNFPTVYDEFICMWSEHIGTHDIYDYDMFMCSEWIKPWTEEDLYDDIYDYMLKIQENVLDSNGMLIENNVDSDEDL